MGEYDSYEKVRPFLDKNHDFTGERQITGSQELVEYYKNTSHRIWLNRETLGFPAHWHQAMEIILPLENIYQAQIAGTTYTLNPGTIFLIPPRMLHEIIAPDSGVRFIFLLDVSLISQLKGFAAIEAIFASPLMISKETHPLIYNDIYQILIQIRNEYFGNNAYAELSIQSLLLNLFIKLGENHNNDKELFPNVKIIKQKEYVQRFNSLLEYIDDHYMDDLSLDVVADIAGFSKFHFSRLFKQYTDFTFNDYLCYRRIKAASEQLLQENYSVTEIALNTGFQSISTFNRIFKKETGCTPREYRNKYTH